MADTDWQIKGEYFETCNCDFVCPCILSNLTAAPSKGECKAAMVFQIASGRYGDTTLDGLTFAVVAHAPGPMAEGGWTVGLIVDEQADDTQRDAIAAITSGGAGGPMAVLAPLVGTFAGMESSPIRVEQSGMRRSASIPGKLEQGLVGMPSFTDPDTPIVVDNTGHPANSRLSLAKATHSHMHAFGVDWDDDSGKNNGHFAPFSWAA